MLRNPFNFLNMGRPARSGMNPARKTGSVPPQQRHEGSPGGRQPVQSQGQSYEQNLRQSRGQNQGQSYEQNLRQSRAQNHGQSDEQNLRQSRGQSQGQSYEQNQGRSRGQNQGQSYGQSQGQGRGQSWGQGHGGVQGFGATPAMHPLVARQRASTQYEPYQKTVRPVEKTADGAVQAAMIQPVIQPVMEIIPLDSTNEAVAKFLENNAKTGYLKIRVSTLQGAIPISGVAIKIYIDIAGTRHLVATDQSDQSGMTQPIPLPAPDKKLTFDPRNPKPYSSYDIFLEHPNYKPEEIKEAPVFDGITSVQPVNMAPPAR